MRPLATFHNQTWNVWAIFIVFTAGLLQGADNAQLSPPSAPTSSDRNALMQKLLRQMLERQEEGSPVTAGFPLAEAAPQPQDNPAEPAQFPPAFGAGTPPTVPQNALPTTPFQPTMPNGSAEADDATQSAPDAAVAGQIALPSGEAAGLRIVPAAETDSATEAVPYIFNFPNSPIEPIFEMFTELTGRMVLYAPNVEGTVNLISGSVELSRAEAVEAITSSLALSGIVLVPMGEKFVKAVLAEEAVQHAPQINRAEDPNLLPESGEFITRSVKLNQVKPSEAVEVLKSLTKTPDGLIPIDSSQTLWIHSDAASMRQMLEVLETIDVVPEDYYSLEVIPIRYSKVGDLYNTMQSLISGSPAADPAATSTSPNQGALGARGFGTGFGAGFGGFGGGYGGGGYNRNYRSGSGVGYRPFQAASTTASNQRNFQDRLQRIVAKASEEEEVPLLSQAKFVPDHRSNSLLIFANQQDLTMITNMIGKVDRLLAQVLIEAVIMEISLGDGLNLGVSLAQQLESRGKWTFGGGVNNPNTSTEVGLGTGNNFLQESLTNAIPFLTNALPGGFNYFGKYNDTLQAAVSAIATDNSTRVISRPRIQTSHAVPGLFSLGERRPFASGGYTSGYTTAGAFNSVEYLDINIQLFVTPYVTPEGYIVMDIAQTANTHVGDVPIVTNTGSPPNDTPIVGQREAQATLSVKDGDTIMLGGYIRQRKVKTRSGVPLLKNIPLLGGLFRSKSDENERREMIILLRASVLETPEEAALVASQERDSIDGIREMEEDFEAERLGKNKKRSRLSRR